MPLENLYKSFSDATPNMTVNPKTELLHQQVHYLNNYEEFDNSSSEQLETSQAKDTGRMVNGYAVPFQDLTLHQTQSVTVQCPELTDSSPLNDNLNSFSSQDNLTLDSLTRLNEHSMHSYMPTTFPTIKYSLDNIKPLVDTKNKTGDLQDYEEQRAKVLGHLLETEQDYLNGLTVLLQVCFHSLI
jgi:hypothetical protein